MCVCVPFYGIGPKSEKRLYRNVSFSPKMCMYANWIISKVHINCAVNSVFSESVVLSPNVSLWKHSNNNLFFAISCFSEVNQ